MRLSEAGRAFLPHAQRALTAVAEGRQLVEEIGRGTVGELRLGATPVVSTYVLPEALARFHEAHPQTRLSVRTGHSEDVLAMVLRDEVQLGLTRALRHADVETTALYDDDLVPSSLRRTPSRRADGSAFATSAASSSSSSTGPATRGRRTRRARDRR